MCFNVFVVEVFVVVGSSGGCYVSCVLSWLACGGALAGELCR